MAVFRGPREEDEQGPGAGDGAARGAPGSAGPGIPFWWFLVQFIRRNRGKVLGVVIGLWAGLGTMALGVFWTVFISACVGVGYFVGRRLDETHEGFLDFLDRVLPPGRG